MFVRPFHSSSLLQTRQPTLYVRVTNRQTVRVENKAKKLLAKGATNNPQNKSNTLASHVRRIQHKAHRDRVSALVSSCAISVPALDPSSDRATDFSKPLVAPFLASHVTRSPRAIPASARHNVVNAVAAARAFTKDSSDATNPSVTDADNSASAKTSTSIRSFRRTTIAGAAPITQSLAPTAAGIAPETVDAITAAASKLSLNESETAVPGFAYGITAAEAKLVLLDAPIHLSALAAKTGKNDAYDASTPTLSSSMKPLAPTASTSTAATKNLEPAEMAELVRRQITLENASHKEITKFNVARMLQLFGRSEFDTGSSEAQAAVLTVKVNAMREHLETFRKDMSTKRRLQAVLAKRATVLKYLRRKNLAKFVVTCRALGIEPETITA
ncbi:ribosomal protein S15 [Chytriomyces hyalinus]|nr:ribosomal protein S15 [Chytriomyces hyalinus]